MNLRFLLRHLGPPLFMIVGFLVLYIVMVNRAMREKSKGPGIEIVYEPSPKIIRYPNGKIMQELHTKQVNANEYPVRHGLQTTWYESGQKSAEGNFKYGMQDGLWVYWHRNGQKRGEGNWKDGKRDGLLTTWWENGQKREKGNWKEDKWQGLWVEWHENGKKMSEEIYKDHKLVEGSAKYWNSKGEPVDSREEAKK